MLPEKILRIGPCVVFDVEMRRFLRGRKKITVSHTKQPRINSFGAGNSWTMQPMAMLQLPAGGRIACQPVRSYLLFFVIVFFTLKQHDVQTIDITILHKENTNHSHVKHSTGEIK